MKNSCTTDAQPLASHNIINASAPLRSAPLRTLALSIGLRHSFLTSLLRTPHVVRSQFAAASAANANLFYSQSSAVSCIPPLKRLPVYNN